MKCHSLFSGENKKNIINMSSAELEKKMVNVKNNGITIVTLL